MNTIVYIGLCSVLKFSFNSVIGIKNKVLKIPNRGGGTLYFSVFLCCTNGETNGRDSAFQIYKFTCLSISKIL